MVPFFRSAACLLPLAFASPLHAQDVQDAAAQVEDPGALTGDRVTLGAGVGVLPSYEGSDDYAVTGVPVAQGRIGGVSFMLRGNRLVTDLIPDSSGPGWDLQLGPAGNVNFNRSVSIRDPQVDRLGKIKVAGELGGIAGIGYQGLITSDFDKLSFSVSYVHDVTGIHDSYVVTPTLDYGTPLSTKTYVAIAVSGNYVGGGYADTYFGVTPAGAARSGLPSFDPGKGWKDWTAGLMLNTALTGDLTGGLSLWASGSYRRLLNDFADSPIVSIAGSRDQWQGGVGLAFTF